MSKLALLALVTITMCALSLAGSEPSPACHRTQFATQLIQDACTRGGQPLAKSTMQRFAKEHRITSCNACHKTLAPSYELKPDALARYRKLGGK